MMIRAPLIQFFSRAWGEDEALPTASSTQIYEFAYVAVWAQEHLTSFSDVRVLSLSLSVTRGAWISRNKGET